MMHVARVRLRKPRRVFSFLCDDPTLQRDQNCVVQSDRGLELGVCILPPEPLPPEMGKRYSMRVIRRMNDEDARTLDQMVEEERKAREVCLRRIREHKIAMKLVDAEYTFDKQKIIFYFTAEDRVDFRELVRDLAHDLRSRIEMRHIQVRDEAKMVGGIGGCGRELCCSTWLNEFRPISMRMAKRQNLALNPSKISGQCGRLLCCLSYENDQYEQAKRRSTARQEEVAESKPEAIAAIEEVDVPAAGAWEVATARPNQQELPEQRQVAEDAGGHSDGAPKRGRRRGKRGGKRKPSSGGGAE